MPAEPVEVHGDPPELDDDLGACREGGQIALPTAEYLISPIGIRPDTQRTAQVIEDDGDLGKGPGERCQLRDLRVKVPGIEAEPQRRQARKSLAKIPIPVQMWRRVDAGLWHVIARIPAGVLTYAPEEALAGLNVRPQQILHAGTQGSSLVRMSRPPAVTPGAARRPRQSARLKRVRV